MTITSIDFETANPSRVSICAAGMAVFENGSLVESPYWLVRPPQGHGDFWARFTGCHGLTQRDVRHEAEFSTIAPEFVSRLMRSDLVIAHNAPFDIGQAKVASSEDRGASVEDGSRKPEVSGRWDRAARCRCSARWSSPAKT